MIALVERIMRDGNATRERLRTETAKPRRGRPKAFTFSFRPATKSFKLSMTFSKSKVERDEIISSLEGIIRELRESE